MLSMTHMIVLFIVVLVVFGPHKLPELARGLGKLMAEFRKASTDFKSAFEQEMRDMERQALQNERRKAAEAAAAAASSAESATALPAVAETPSQGLDGESAPAEAPVITPVAESVARSSENGESAPASTESSALSSSPHDSSHDQQQPA